MAKKELKKWQVRFEEVSGSAPLQLLIIALLGALDHVTGPNISFSLFYVLPIAAVTWRLDRKWGLGYSLLCAMVWAAVEEMTRSADASDIVVIWNGIVRLLFFSIITILLSKIKQMYLEEEKHADTDALTGLSNRRSYLEKAELELDRSRRYNFSHTIAYIDLDNFKAVNDTQGHTEGDMLLKCVAGILAARLRSTDVKARLGGDEFAILLPQTGLTDGGEIMKELRATLLSEMALHNWPVTFSIGVVTMLEPMASMKESIKLTDDLMYYVKKNGKNEIAHLCWPFNKETPENLLDVTCDFLKKETEQNNSSESESEFD